MSAMHITVAICGMVLAGTVGFIFGWLQGHVEAARDQTNRMAAERNRVATHEAEALGDKGMAEQKGGA